MTDVIIPEPKVSGVKRRKFRDLLHRLTLLAAIITPLLFIIAALGAKFGVWDWRFGLGTLSRGIGLKMLAATLGLGVLSVIAAALITPRKGLWIGGLAAIIALAGIAKGAATQKTVASLPFIHDVSTDTQNPPQFSGVILAERAKVEGVNTLEYIGKKAPTGEGQPPELVSALQTKAYPNVRPLVVGGKPDVVFGEALSLVKSMGWTLKDSNLEAGTIEATAETFWYGFKDDVVIRIQPAEGGGSIVDLRSVSRVGMSDIGANAARVTSFLEKLAG